MATPRFIDMDLGTGNMNQRYAVAAQLHAEHFGSYDDRDLTLNCLDAPNIIPTGSCQHIPGHDTYFPTFTWRGF